LQEKGIKFFEGAATGQSARTELMMSGAKERLQRKKKLLPLGLELRGRRACKKDRGLRTPKNVGISRKTPLSWEGVQISQVKKKGSSKTSNPMHRNVPPTETHTGRSDEEGTKKNKSGHRELSDRRRVENPVWSKG